MGLQKDISELVKEGVISAETASKIESYYHSKQDHSSNRLFLVFAILGALLVGLGIILIVAHNWDGLSRLTKTILSFVPLLIGQAASGYTLWKKKDSVAWREGSSTFLFFAVGASISLISQVYNIPGNMSSFIISWMVLCLPLVYLLKSSVVSLLYIIGITSYATLTGFGRHSEWPAFYFWPLLLLILPNYYQLYQKKTGVNFLNFHHLFIPISLMIVFPIWGDFDEIFALSVYMSFFGILYLLGHSDQYRPTGKNINVFTALGSVGTVSLLLGCSFNDVWLEITSYDNNLLDEFKTFSFAVTLLLTLLASFLFVQYFNKKGIAAAKPIAPIFILFLIILIIGFYTTLSVVLINLLVLFIGVMTIREGALKDHLGILNYGLLIITSLIAFRFFDGDLSFVWRGIMFLVVGTGFFLTNNWMLKRRKGIQNLQT